MKPYLIFFLLVLTGISPSSTSAQMSRIKSTIDQIDAEAHLRFLTADELRGRNTGTIELNIAGRYIAEQFRKSGLIPLGDEEDDYLQRVKLYLSKTATKGSATLLDLDFNLENNLGILKGVNGEFSGPLIFVNNMEDVQDMNLTGKIVVMILRDARSAIMNQDKIKIIQSFGGVGLIEIFGPGQQFPWAVIKRFLNREKMVIGEALENQSIPYIWVRDTTDQLIQRLKNGEGGSANMSIMGIKTEDIETYNIVGKIEGSDPVLKNEHVIMCAHYDHVGIQSGEGQDTIYNGTRDNGIGTTGLINAAKYFGKYPPKRSLVIIALTGEEKGLLGSQYYTMFPQIPLEESVFALNIDNSGYTDTENITLLDTARTNIDALVYQAAKEAGLGVMGDRIPSQGYYERSDQVSFASKGVPAINFKMSMEAFDERISKYYHKANDEFDSVDHAYVYKYWISYIRSAELIANWDQTPYWMPGDKFEDAGNKLYNKMD